MANRELTLTDSLWQQLRGIVAEYDVKVITASAPRRTSVMPQFDPSRIVVVDYINMLGNTSFKENEVCNEQVTENAVLSNGSRTN